MGILFEFVNYGCQVHFVENRFSPFLSIASSEFWLAVGSVRPMCGVPEMCIQLEIPGFYWISNRKQLWKLKLFVPHFLDCLFDELDMTSLFVIQTGFIVIVMFPYDRLRSLCSPLLGPTQWNFGPLQASLTTWMPSSECCLGNKSLTIAHCQSSLKDGHIWCVWGYDDGCIVASVRV